MVRRRRRQSELQPARSLPNLVARLGAVAACSFDDVVKENQLCCAEHECTGGNNKVQSRICGWVIAGEPRHTFQSHNHHQHENHVEGNYGHPEMQLAKFFVIHMPGHLRQVKVCCCHQPQSGASHERVMEMPHYIHGGMVLRVRRDIRYDKAGQPANTEHDHCAQCEEHGRFKSHGAAPDGGNPAKNHHRCRDGNGHGHEHEE